MQCYKCATPVPDNARFCSTCGTDVSGESHRHSGATLAMEGDPQLFSKLQAELGTDFVLEKELGRGGMAVVYLGRDAHLNRKVAVKVLPPELTYGGGGSMIERFKREAQTAAKLDHPNIIPVFRVSTSGTLFWYVMKYLDGEALNDILEREGQLPVERTVDIVSQVAGALDYAHQNQVVHRDVKPANVLVDRKGWCTVTDFGIAKALDANTLTASGSIIGTPYYMSPEQCKGKKVGPAADQYSLAVMAYQMLGGHVPFTGDSAVEIVHKHVADPVPPLGVLRPELPEKVVAVVEKGLAKDAEDRFATTTEFAKALKDAAQGIDVQLAPPRKPAPARMSKTALVSPVPGALRTARGTWRERKGLVFGTLGGLVVVAGIAGALVLRPWEPKTTGPSVTGPAVGAQTPTEPAAIPPSSANVESVAVRGDTAPAPAATGVSRMARLELRGAPAGATFSLDGRRVSGPRFQAEAGRRHTVSVARTGFETWTSSVTPVAGQRTTVSVTMQPSAGAPAVQPQPAVAQPQPTPVPVAPSVAATGFVTVASSPASATIIINGQAQQRNPVRDFVVPAGTVTIRFLVTDSTTGATWSQETSCVVAAGEHKNCGRTTLRRS